MQLNYNFHSRKKEINEAKEISFGIVRNLIGAVAFMTLMLLFPFRLACLTYEVVTQVIIGFRGISSLAL
jgi:hypothetical protein